MLPINHDAPTADEEQDEFAEHFKRVRPPNVLITTSYKVTGVMYRFISELLEVWGRGSEGRCTRCSSGVQCCSEQGL